LKAEFTNFIKKNYSTALFYRPL